MDSSDNQTTTCDDCMVCLCPMNVPTYTITTNCGHIFHTECISKWHDKQTNVFNCPACRESLKSTPKIIYDIPDSNNTLCTYFNRDTLEGVRENGEFTGQCKATYLTENDDAFIQVGDTFEGTYENGEFTGYCEHIGINGWKREGIYKNGEFEGGGTKITYPEGHIFVYENGRDRIGHCKATFPNGDVVEGMHNRPWFKGECKFTYVNGNVVYGVLQWMDELKWKQNYHIGTPVFQYDKKSRLINRFDSIKSCAKSLKCSRHQITDRLKGVECHDTARYPVNDYLNQYVFSGKKL
jgi:hypothetical protein